jgi:hypothetical protein
MAAAARSSTVALLKLHTPHTDAQAMDAGLLEVLEPNFTTELGLCLCR